MRALALLAALVVATGALAGCVNGEKDDPITPGSTPDGNGGANPTPGGSPSLVTVLAPLSLSIDMGAPEWVAPGTAITVSVPVPEKAVGEVKHVWALGPLPGTVEVDASYDTGSKSADLYIQPGDAASVTFDKAGTFLMHCHPHAWMNANVTVVDGYAGPDTVHVQIIDGEKPHEYRYVPENVLVGVGTTVVYHNNGTQPHTATLMTPGPALKKLPLEAASGEVTLEGDGWQRLVVVATDSEGRIGYSEKRVYVAELPTFEKKEFPLEFTAGGAPDAAVAPFTASFTTEHAGLLFLNFTVQDAGAPACGASEGAPGPASGAACTALVEVHLQEQGATQDTLTSDASSSGELKGRIQPTVYTLTVIPKQGAMITGTAVVEVVYDAIPPEPAMSSGGDGGHGGHGGHAH